MNSNGEVGIGKTVCVTGASGYIASWLIKLLLQRNYTVKASVRDLNDPRKTKHLIELPGAKDRLHLYEAQLMEQGSFDAVIHGCDGVFHVASPCFWDTNDPQADLIEPAVNGTLNVLRSCSKTPSVKRVIFTSSMATALHNGKPRTPDVVVDETWFSDPEFCKKFKLWYHLSKTLAEDSAMEFAKEHGIDLVIINPAACLGPLLQPSVNSSAQFILNLLTGAQTYKNVTLGWVDVRDVGNAHILAFEAPSSEGRYFVLERTAHFSEVVKILRELYPDIQLPGKIMSVEAAATLAAPTLEKTAACISDFSARHVRYLTRFEENYETLIRKMSELRCHRDHVKRRVEVDEVSQQMRRTPIVAQWFERVRSFEVEVDAVLQECSCEIETGQRCCVNYCPKNWWLRYKIGKKVSKKLEVVVEVISNGQFEVVADKVLPSLVEVKYESQSVGMHEAFSQVSSWLVDDAVKIIGIYGMGGVGKTTLLKKINNVFKEKVDMLNVVIWVVVSSHPSLENVQRQIGKRLGLPWSEDENQNEKAQLIFNALTKKKFLLLLDDVWKPLNFEEIGIPCQNPHSKVVFTTRSESVCGEMEADKKLKVPILERQQAWELFQHKVGQEVLNCHPEIPKLAKTVARECGGLPLALITIGRAMSSKKTTHEWNHALKTLKNNASEFKGMEEKVLSILKFSYDNLEDDTARYCFLYFSLYPEDWEIPIDHIIRRWIGEGFLDKFKDMDDALNKGHDIIGSLKAACLLETSTWGDSCVKMHDNVRDLALWITSDCGKKENKHLVQAGVGLSQAHEIEGWKNAERISLMENNLKELTGTPKCYRLVTLMLQRNLNLSVISDDFFCNMPILNVLDLSYTGIKVVPKSVGGLLQLQILNLVSTDIDSLPEELGNLVKLKYLNLGGTRVSTIPRGMVSCFSKMQMLYFGETKLDDSLAAELECLEQLRELGITIRNIPTPISQQLTSCITTLEIKDCVGLTELSLLSSPLFRKTRRWREFEIRDCLELETFNINCLEEDEDEMGPLFTLMELQICGLPKLNNIIWAETSTHLQFSHLHAVLIRSCPTLKDISWLVSAPMLRYLKIGDCLELEEIILGRFTTTIDRNQDLFSRLEYFDLEGLLKLKSIVRFAPLFPCLRGIFVSDCPLLKKLPLASASTDKSKLVIRGKADWWNELQWENEIVKSTFQPFFRPRRVK